MCLVHMYIDNTVKCVVWMSLDLWTVLWSNEWLRAAQNTTEKMWYLLAWRHGFLGLESLIV